MWHPESWLREGSAFSICYLDDSKNIQDCELPTRIIRFRINPRITKIAIKTIPQVNNNSIIPLE